MKNWPLIFILGIPILLIILFVWFRHVGLPQCLKTVSVELIDRACERK